MHCSNALRLLYKKGPYWAISTRNTTGVGKGNLLVAVIQPNDRHKFCQGGLADTLYCTMNLHILNYITCSLPFITNYKMKLAITCLASLTILSPQSGFTSATRSSRWPWLARGSTRPSRTGLSDRTCRSWCARWALWSGFTPSEVNNRN